MNEHHVSQSEQSEPEDVEQRLMAYYGSQATRTHPPTCFVAVCAPSTRDTSGNEMQEQLASSPKKITSLRLHVSS